MKLSVTSVSMPGLDLVETCQLLSKLGYDGVELRVRYTPESAMGKGYTSPWGEHKTDLAPDNLAAKAADVAKIVSDHGLQIAAIASNLRADEIDDIKLLADGVSKLGNVPIRIGAPSRYDRTMNYDVLYDEAVEAYAKVLETLKPYGLKTLIEIHVGSIMVSASLAHRVVSHFSAEELGVIYDVNNMALDGFETFRIGMELLGPYMQHNHASGYRPVATDQRDERGTLKWAWEICDLSDSILDIPQYMADLKAVGYEGYISIEDFRATDLEERLRRNLEYLRALE
jgi:sugar phosphate isomerase/epimerase